MQTAKLPTTVCEQLDKINRDFLWSYNGDNNPGHLVNWDTVASPLVYGGLGVKKAKCINQALLAKIGWRLHQHKDMLWAKVYSKKYLKRSDLTQSTRHL